MPGPRAAIAAWWLNAPFSPWIATVNGFSARHRSPPTKPKGPSRFVRERAFVADRLWSAAMPTRGPLRWSG